MSHQKKLEGGRGIGEVYTTAGDHRPEGPVAQLLLCTQITFWRHTGERDRMIGAKALLMKFLPALLGPLTIVGLRDRRALPPTKASATLLLSATSSQFWYSMKSRRIYVHIFGIQPASRATNPLS